MLLLFQIASTSAIILNSSLHLLCFAVFFSYDFYHVILLLDAGWTASAAKLRNRFENILNPILAIAKLPCNND